MKASTKVYIVFIAVTLAVGALAAALTMGSMEDYGKSSKAVFRASRLAFSDRLDHIVCPYGCCGCTRVDERL